MRSLRRSQRKLKSKLRSKSFSPQRRRSFFGGERRLRVFQKIAPTEIDNLLPALVLSALQALRHKDQKDFIFFRDKAVKMYGAKAVKQEATRQRSFDSA
jgi:hypothetical protein